MARTKRSKPGQHKKISKAETVKKEAIEVKDPSHETKKDNDKKRLVDDSIDAIFASKKKRSDPENTEAPPKQEPELEKVQVIKPPPDDDGFGDSRGILKTNRRTDDGFRLFTADELRIGNGGDSKDCPFDCWCCF